MVNKLGRVGAAQHSICIRAPYRMITVLLGLYRGAPHPPPRSKLSLRSIEPIWI